MGFALRFSVSESATCVNLTGGMYGGRCFAGAVKRIARRFASLGGGAGDVWRLEWACLPDRGERCVR